MEAPSEAPWRHLCRSECRHGATGLVALSRFVDSSGLAIPPAAPGPVLHGIFVWPGLAGPFHRNLSSPPYSGTGRVVYLLFSSLKHVANTKCLPHSTPPCQSGRRLSSCGPHPCSHISQPTSHPAPPVDTTNSGGSWLLQGTADRAPWFLLEAQAARRLCFLPVPASCARPRSASSQSSALDRGHARLARSPPRTRPPGRSVCHGDGKPSGVPLHDDHDDEHHVIHILHLVGTSNDHHSSRSGKRDKTANNISQRHT